MKNYQFLKSIGILAIVAGAIVLVNLVNASGVYPQVNPPLGNLPAFLDISSSNQAKLGSLALGATAAGYVPTATLDVKGSVVTDLVGVLSTGWITKHLKFSSGPSIPVNTESTLYVLGSRIRSVVLAGSGERPICADSLGRLIICAVNTPIPVDGTCDNSTNGQILSTAPVAPNLCTTGTASVVSGSGPWTWSCNGSNGGATANCAADPVPANPIDGLCGTYPAPLCNVGVASATYWSLHQLPPNHQNDFPPAVQPHSIGWTCQGSGGGQDAVCTNGQLECPPGFTMHGCFLPGTEITLANGSKKAIETIAAGDSVLAAGDNFNAVNNLLKHEYQGWVYGINGSKPFVTGMHPMMTTEGWKSFEPEKTFIAEPDVKIAGALKKGDILIKENGIQEPIKDFTRVWMNTTVYNLNTTGTHEYYADGYQVHNKTTNPWCSVDTVPNQDPQTAFICNGDGYGAGGGCNIGTMTGYTDDSAGTDSWYCNNIPKTSLASFYDNISHINYSSGTYYIATGTSTDAAYYSGMGSSPTITVWCGNSPQ